MSVQPDGIHVPRISVVTPTFNNAAHVREALDSVLAQTFDDWEMLVIDDGCTDDTSAIVASYGDPRIRQLAHPGGVNRGQCLSRIVGCEAARGDVVAFLDADDVWEPTYLERHLMFWESVQPEGVVMTYGPFVNWGTPAGGQDTISRVPPPGVHATGTLLDRWLASVYEETPVPAVVFLRPDIYPQIRSRAHLAHGSGHEDQFLYWYVGARHPIAIHDQVLVKYRMHDTSMSATRSVPRRDRDELQFLRTTLPDLQELLPGYHVTVESVPRRILALKAWRRRDWRRRFARAVQDPVHTGSQFVDRRRGMSVRREQAEI